MKPRTVSGLKAELRAANDEAKAYLQQVCALRRDNEALCEHISVLKRELHRETERVNGLDHACAILFRSLEQYQQRNG